MSAPAGQPGAPKEDYLDKAVDSIEKRIGQSTGHPVDTNKYREKNEKFTDKLRGFREEDWQEAPRQGLQLEIHAT